MDLLFTAVGVGLDSGTDPGSGPPIVSTGDLYGNMITVIISLVFIIGIIVFLIKFLAQKNRRWTKDRSLRIIAGVALGQNKTLQIIEIGESIYIIGVGENITLIDKINDVNQVEALLQSFDNDSMNSSQPFTTLNQFIRKIRNNAGSSAEEQVSNDTFRELLKVKLRNTDDRRADMKSWLEDNDAQRRSDELR
jgi:flagellar protein FliO/FliZ